MDNEYRVGKPKEGLNTLVARFSFTHFDKAVEKIKMLPDMLPPVDRETWNVELIIPSVC